jgi:hypothetical protein
MSIILSELVAADLKSLNWTRPKPELVEANIEALRQDDYEIPVYVHDFLSQFSGLQYVPPCYRNRSIPTSKYVSLPSFGRIEVAPSRYTIDFVTSLALRFFDQTDRKSFQDLVQQSVWPVAYGLGAILLITQTGVCYWLCEYWDRYTKAASLSDLLECFTFSLWALIEEVELTSDD